METIVAAIRWIHVAAGFVGLAAFWVPVFARKGGRNHVLFGKIFEWCAYIVLAGAGLSVLYRLDSYSAQGISLADGRLAFIYFLGYLAFVTFVIIRHALSALRTKDFKAIATPLNFALAYGSILASVALITYAIVVKPDARIVLFALSPIGFGVGFGNLRYLRGREKSKRGWFYEHLGGMLGAGIAFHTAFAVFGANRLFNLGLEGWLAVMPWILPALVGIPASVIWTRYYRRRFGELPVQ